MMMTMMMMRPKKTIRIIQNLIFIVNSTFILTYLGMQITKLNLFHYFCEFVETIPIKCYKTTRPLSNI